MPGEHSEKQKRQAKHIAESEKAKGMPADKADSVAWATVAAGKKKKAAESTPKPKKK